jgi:heme-degrading monooxygenase HmoA
MVLTVLLISALVGSASEKPQAAAGESEPFKYMTAFTESVGPDEKLIESVSLPVNPKNEAKFVSRMNELLKELRKAPGLEQVKLYRRRDSGSAVEYSLFEIWKGRDGLRAWWSNPTLAGFQRDLRAQNLLGGAPELNFATLFRAH